MYKRASQNIAMNSKKYALKSTNICIFSVVLLLVDKTFIYILFPFESKQVRNVHGKGSFWRFMMHVLPKTWFVLHATWRLILITKIQSHSNFRCGVFKFCSLFIPTPSLYATLFGVYCWISKSLFDMHLTHAWGVESCATS